MLHLLTFSLCQRQRALYYVLISLCSMCVYSGFERDHVRVRSYCVKHHSSVYLCFSWRKQSIWDNELLQLLLDCYLKGAICELMCWKSILVATLVCLRMCNGVFSHYFLVHSGVKQGTVLSPCSTVLCSYRRSTVASVRVGVGCFVIVLCRSTCSCICRCHCAGCNYSVVKSN